MNLPGSFQSYGTTVLARHPEIVHEWSIESNRCDLSIPARSPNGFDIQFEIDMDAATVHWGNWHTRFESTDTLVEELFGLLRDMLSPDMRIRELCANSKPYRGFLETYDGTHWSTEHEMGLIIWNYFGKRSVRTYSNSILPGRMSKPDLGAVPDRQHGSGDAR